MKKLLIACAAAAVAAVGALFIPVEVYESGKWRIKGRKKGDNTEENDENDRIIRNGSLGSVLIDKMTVKPIAGSEDDNVDCVRCKDCHDCISSDDCTACVGCEACDDCIGCVDCFDCDSCTDCVECVDCVDCTGCVECVGLVGESGKVGINNNSDAENETNE